MNGPLIRYASGVQEFQIHYRTLTLTESETRH